MEQEVSVGERHLPTAHLRGIPASRAVHLPVSHPSARISSLSGQGARVPERIGSSCPTSRNQPPRKCPFSRRRDVQRPLPALPPFFPVSFLPPIAAFQSTLECRILLIAPAIQRCMTPSLGFLSFQSGVPQSLHSFRFSTLRRRCQILAWFWRGVFFTANPYLQ